MKKGLRLIGNSLKLLLIIGGCLGTVGIYVYSKWVGELHYYTPIVLGIAFFILIFTWIVGLLKGRGNSILFPVLMLSLISSFVISIL